MIFYGVLHIFPDWVESVVGRIVDLIDPFKEFYYYDCRQKGSCSIKNVLPAVVGKGYSDMGISGGGEASVAFYDIYFNDGVKADASRIRRELEEYCGLDTYGMVLIVGKLKSLV